MFRKKTKISLLLVVIISFIAIWFIPFTKKSGFGNPEKEKDIKEQNVIVALGSEPRTLDPRKATDANGMRLVDLMFQSLIRLGPQQKILPHAAQSWSYKNKIYTFIINKDLKFSNGRKINKEDIFFSFKEYQSEKSPFSSAFKIIDSIDIQEETKRLILKIKLKEESAKFLTSDLPVLKILPKNETLSNNEDFQNNLIGTGPFKFKSRSSNQLVLEARQDVTPAPKIDKVTFKIIRDDLTRFQKILNGEIDVAQSEISFQKIDHLLKRKDRFQVFQKPGSSMTYLLINFKDECLSKKNVRQIITNAINRSQIIKHKLKNFAHIATTILSPNNVFFNADINNHLYNLNQAKKIFNQIGACRQKTFSLKTSNARSAMDHGKIIALQLKKAGLQIKTESFEWGTFYGDLNAGRFHLALLKWVGVVDPDIYRMAFHSKEHPPKGRNRGFYKNKLLDQLLDQGVAMMDQKKRRYLYHQVQEIIQEDIAFIPLWHENQTGVAQKNILNYSLSDNGDFYYLVHIFKQGK